MSSDKGCRAAGVSEWAQFDFSESAEFYFSKSAQFFFQSLPSGWVWFSPLCTAVAEFDWHPLWKINDLTRIKSTPRLFFQIHIRTLPRRQNSQFFLWKPGLIRRAGDGWNENSVACPLSPFQPNKGKEGFSGGHFQHMWHIQFCGIYCSNRLWSWRGENRELESKFVNSCLSLLPSPRQGQTTLVRTVVGTKRKLASCHTSWETFLSTSQSVCNLFVCNVNANMLREG